MKPERDRIWVWRVGLLAGLCAYVCVCTRVWNEQLIKSKLPFSSCRSHEKFMAPLYLSPDSLSIPSCCRCKIEADWNRVANKSPTDSIHFENWSPSWSYGVRLNFFLVEKSFPIKLVSSFNIDFNLSLWITKFFSIFFPHYICIRSKFPFAQAFFGFVCYSFHYFFFSFGSWILCRLIKWCRDDCSVRICFFLNCFTFLFCLLFFSYILLFTPFFCIFRFFCFDKKNFHFQISVYYSNPFE